MTEANTWKRGGYERGAYWAVRSGGLQGFSVEYDADDAVWRANCRKAQKERDAFIRVENNRLQGG